MFPKLLTGPIVRYRAIRSELKERTAPPPYVAQGFQRFVLGLAKKTLIADQLARITTPFFRAAHPDFSTGIAWVVLVAYTLQIYYDFSGYTDMAIGMGAMLGFHLPENFRRPYASLSITEFWRRWHMTLSFWFRDYVFLPLEYARRQGQARARADRYPDRLPAYRLVARHQPNFYHLGLCGRGCGLSSNSPTPASSCSEFQCLCSGSISSWSL